MAKGIGQREGRGTPSDRVGGTEGTGNTRGARGRREIRAQGESPPKTSECLQAPVSCGNLRLYSGAPPAGPFSWLAPSRTLRGPIWDQSCPGAPGPAPHAAPGPQGTHPHSGEEEKAQAVRRGQKQASSLALWLPGPAGGPLEQRRRAPPPCLPALPPPSPPSRLAPLPGRSQAQGPGTPGRPRTCRPRQAAPTSPLGTSLCLPKAYRESGLGPPGAAISKA